MLRTRTRRAAVRAWLPLVACLLVAPTAAAHETGAHHPHALVTHGDPDKALPDSLITQPVAQQELAGVDGISVDAGTAPETWCGTQITTNNTANEVAPAGSAHYKLVYAYAADQTNRFDTFKDKLQADVSLLQRYLATQSDSRKALRWDMGTDCGAQYVDIQVVPLPQNRDYYVPGGAPSFTRIVTDVRAAVGAGGPRNLAVYADALRGTNGVAGEGQRYTTDATTTSSHDSGGLAALVYGTASAPSGSYAEPSVLMHEIGHNLGAVQDTSPQSSQAGHCFDEWDVMCYADGGPRGQLANMVTNCGGLTGGMTETWDCNRDDYFNPFPADGSYLDLKWNTYAVAHLGPCSTELVDACGVTGAAADGTKPVSTTAQPAMQWRTGWSATIMGTDTESPIDAYQWTYADFGTALPAVTRDNQITITGEHAGQVDLYHRLRDSAGNWSTWRRDPVFIDNVAPTAIVDCPDTWSTTTAPVCSYEVTEEGSGLWYSEVYAGNSLVAYSQALSGTVTATADAQPIRVQPRDGLSNIGDEASDTARWDRVNPTVDVTCPVTAGAGSTTCHVDASDAASGIDTVTWRVGSGAPTEVEANSDFNVTTPGDNTITAVATDVAGLTSQDTATAHVTAGSSPTGTDNTVATAEDTARPFTAGDFGFSDPDSHTFADVRIDTLPGAGTLRSNGADATAGQSYAPGTLTFTPAANACAVGYASFTFSVRDSSGSYDSSPNTMTIDVTCVDDDPVAEDDSKTLDEDAGATTIDVRANDIDDSLGTKTITAKTNGTHGVVAITNSGADLTYTPNENYCGTDSFDYTLNGGSTATVALTVTCVDDNPVAVNDSKTVDEDAEATTIDVRANDTDDNVGTKTITGATDAAHGTVAITNGGADLTYEPAANYCGTDSFTYSLNGGSTATVNVNVTCVDDDPVAEDDTETVSEDSGSTTFDVRANDTNDNLGSKTVTGKTDGTRGTVTITNSGDDLTYTPDANYCGDDSFTYELNGGSTATVNVTITCVNDVSVATDDPSATVAEDSDAATIDVRANDTDADPDEGPAAIESVTQGAHGAVAITNGGADLTYTPAVNYCGDDSFDYTLVGGSTATVTVDVTCVNDPSDAVDDTKTLDEDAALTGLNVRANDTDAENSVELIGAFGVAAHGSVGPDDFSRDINYQPNANYCGPDELTYTLTGGDTATVSITVTCVDDPSHAVDDSRTVAQNSGATTIDVRANDDDVEADVELIDSTGAAGHGVVAITNGGANLTYTPSAYYCGSDSFTYTLVGGSIATVTITVPCDQPPVATDDSKTVAEDSPATTIDVLANDTDADGDTPVIEGKTDGAHGTVEITNAGADLSYTPNQDFCGTDSFTYSLNGGSTATVSVTVTCVDDNPTAENDTKTLNEDASAITIDVRANDTNDNLGDKTIVEKTDGTHGTVAITNTGDDLTYTPNQDYCGPDSFTYTLNGGSTGTVNVTVTCLDDDPVAVNDTETLSEDSGPTTFDVRTNDTDDNLGTKTITGTTDAVHGAVTITNSGADVTYTPAANYCGDDSFTYTLNGGSTATVNVTVTCVDDDPTAEADTKTLDEDAGATTIDVRANDTDDNLGTKTITGTTNPAHGTVTITITDDVSYTPDADYCGTDSFTYTLNGGSTATVNVTVTCVDDDNDAPIADPAPVAVNDSKTVAEDAGASTIDVLANDTDSDGRPKIRSTTNGGHGQVAITNNGADLTYTADANYCGADSFTYTLNGGSTATVSVTVSCVDDVPIALDDVTAVDEDAWAIFDVRANDADIDGGAKTIASKTDAAHAATAITADGADIAYKPDPNYCGTDSFTYTLNGGSTATVTVLVACEPDEVLTDDTRPPQTTIANGPKKTVATTRRMAKVTFKIKSSEAGSTFWCKLDRGWFRRCGPKNSYKLKPGRHTFWVSAADAAGNVDTTPVKKRVRVVRIEPPR